MSNQIPIAKLYEEFEAALRSGELLSRPDLDEAMTIQIVWNE
jgi:hypothetical protein